MNQFLIPCYVGKDPKSDSYFFISQKEGFGRFIKYTRYPFWCGSSAVSDFLALVEAPEDVVLAVQNFVADRLAIEIVPKVRGRPERIFMTVLPEKSGLEKDGVNNVAEDKKPPGRSESTIGDSGNGGRKTAAEVSQKERKKHTNGKGNSLSQKATSQRADREEEPRRIFKTSSGTGPSGLRRLPGDGCDIKHNVTSEPPSNAFEGSGRGLESESGVLGTQGGSAGGYIDTAGLLRTTSSTLDGSVKPKRKRRTKLEMEAARAESNKTI
jgi:hypothetical protein